MTDITIHRRSFLVGIGTVIGVAGIFGLGWLYNEMTRGSRKDESPPEPYDAAPKVIKPEETDGGENESRDEDSYFNGGGEFEELEDGYSEDMSRRDFLNPFRSTEGYYFERPGEPNRNKSPPEVPFERFVNDLRRGTLRPAKLYLKRNRVYGHVDERTGTDYNIGFYKNRYTGRYCLVTKVNGRSYRFSEWLRYLDRNGDCDFVEVYDAQTCRCLGRFSK